MTTYLNTIVEDHNEREWQQKPGRDDDNHAQRKRGFKHQDGQHHQSLLQERVNRVLIQQGSSKTQFIKNKKSKFSIRQTNNVKYIWI